MKYCVECKHVIVRLPSMFNPVPPPYHFCSHPERLDPVSKTPVDAERERKSGTCGPDALLYERKE